VVASAVSVRGCLLVLAGCGSDLPRVTTFDTPARDVAELEARIERLRGELGVPGLGLAIARNDEIVWSKGLGLADREAGLAPTGDTSFHLASLTKTFTSTLVMQLVEEGHLSLDDPVSDYGVALPGVRVRHLLTHTSAGVPGDAYAYDGDRFALLQPVVERASGRTFGALLVDRILKPLDLRHTAPNLDHPTFDLAGLDRAAFAANLARPYAVDASGRPSLSRYPTSFGASAGLIGSARDMALYSMAIDRHAFLRAETQELVFTSARTNRGQPIPYGLGWFVQGEGSGKLVWHYGLWTCNSSLIVKAPARGLTFVALANADTLTAAYPMAAGDVTVSPIAREFVRAYVESDARLP
jgi:CubicO group peptidase (beta-lactamase class C family)